MGAHLFIATIRAMYAAETSFDYDYLYVSENFEQTGVLHCEHARLLVEQSEGAWTPGFTCKTLDKALEEIWEQGSEELADWFLYGGGCQVRINIASGVMAWGAVRLFIV